MPGQVDTMVGPDVSKHADDSSTPEDARATRDETEEAVITLAEGPARQRRSYGTAKSGSTLVISVALDDK